MTIRLSCQRFLTEEGGTPTVESALVTVLIAAVAVKAVTTLGAAVLPISHGDVTSKAFGG